MQNDILRRLKSVFVASFDFIHVNYDLRITLSPYYSILWL